MNLNNRSFHHAHTQARKKTWKYGSLRKEKTLESLKERLKKSGRKLRRFLSRLRRMLRRSNKYWAVLVQAAIDHTAMVNTWWEIREQTRIELVVIVSNYLIIKASRTVIRAATSINLRTRFTLTSCQMRAALKQPIRMTTILRKALVLTQVVSLNLGLAALKANISMAPKAWATWVRRSRTPTTTMLGPWK